MFNPKEIIIESFIKELQLGYQRNFGNLEPSISSVIAWMGRLALENIANSDALYHNVDHTIMVTLVGQEILRGKHLKEGGVTPRDWLHFIMALLCHDIGYVKGVCRSDEDSEYASGVDDKLVKLPADATDAALMPYHVDRSKLFVRERFGEKLLIDLDIEEIVSYIEMTRFPFPDDDAYKDTKSYRGLVRAADFIGQLGDPNYIVKIPALFHEFEETEINAKTGYQSPGDMRKNYAKFYWGVVSPYIQDALRYLRITMEGNQWIANLHKHVFDVEHTEDQ